MLKRLFQVDYFRIVVVEDATTVELCGALKVLELLCTKFGAATGGNMHAYGMYDIGATG